MKHLFILTILSLLFGCQTNNKPLIGELHIVAQYCKYPNNDFLILPFELCKDGESIKLDTIMIYRKIKPKRLPFGTYEIIFESIYQKQETVEFELNNKTQNITLCVDKIDYQLSNSDLFINRLEEGDKLIIDFNSSGCFHSIESQLEIIKNRNFYSTKLKDSIARLTSKQLQFIKEFEFELRNIKSNQCTTSDTYGLGITKDSEVIEFVDGSCHWNGFENLLKKLRYKN